MPEIVSCPDCGRKLRVPDDLLGRNVKCPGCGKKFLADAGGPDDRRSAVAPRYDEVPPLPDYDDRPTPRRRRDYEDEGDYDYPERRRDVVEPSRGEIRQGWERVRMGINLVIIAMWVGIGGIALVLAAGLLLTLFGAFSFFSIVNGVNTSAPVTEQQASQAVGQAVGTGCAIWIGLILLWGVTILCGLAYAALRITGLGFCMGVAPTRKTQGLKPLAIATFCLAIAGLVFPMVFAGADFALLQTNLGGCLVFTGYPLMGLVGLAEFICFFLFLRGAALALRKEGLAQNLLVYMIVVPVFSLAAVGSMFVLPAIGAALFVGSAASSSSPGAAVGNVAGGLSALIVGGWVCFGLFVALSLGLLIWYVMLLYQVRGAIDDRLDRG